MSNRLKGKDGHWVENLVITEELWKKIMKETLQRVLRLLESAEILLDNGGNGAICAGIYTYALEEYGKILLLKQSSHVNGKVKIKYRKGFRYHPEKFRLAINNLPKECTTLKKPAFNSKSFDPDIFDTEEVIADLEARMAVFYTDFLDSGDGVKPIPPVDKKLLKNAINILRKIAHGTNLP